VAKKWHHMIKISVIIPTYNYARYIVEAVDKTLAQADENVEIEVIIVDDGSTDNTAFALKNYVETGKIQYIFQKNQGKAAATRKAIELATGQYIFNLDADDFFLPNKINAFIEVFEAHPSVIHVGSAAKVINADGTYISTEKISLEWVNKPVNGRELTTHFLKKNTLWAGGSTYAARADVLKKLVIPDAVDMYLDEYLILGILSKGDSYCFSDPLSIWRVHGNNYSNSRDTQQAEKTRRLLNSSAGTLDALRENGDLPANLLKIYAFKHQTRVIASAENAGQKSLKMIGRYAKNMWRLRAEGVDFFKHYTSFNRLIPTKLLHFVKRLTPKDDNK
jgi:glycosyltransferase involved in cell wall biosynthesis